jgi:hypothetical protein
MRHKLHQQHRQVHLPKAVNRALAGLMGIHFLNLNRNENVTNPVGTISSTSGTPAGSSPLGSPSGIDLTFSCSSHEAE